MPEPRLAASVLPLRPRPGGGVETVIVRRAAGLRYLAGFHSLPGGRVEEADVDLPTDAGPGEGGVAAAALRELFEETGVLVTTGRLDPSERERLRTTTASDPRHLARALRARGLALATSRLTPLLRILTPAYTPTRYLSSFYAAPVDPGSTATPQAPELDEARWLTPADALEGHARGELALTYPSLECLRRLGTSAAAAELYPHPGGEMLAGVHLLALRSPTIPPNTHTNTYLLGGEDLVVVDPAPLDVEERALLWAYLERARAAGGALRAIWLTHHHPDHVGAVAWLRERTGAPVWAHPWTADALAPELRVDRTIDEGDELTLSIGQGRRATWRALHLPGHCPGHLCFHEPQRGALLAGDLMAGIGTVVVAPPEGDMQAYLDSLERLLTLPLSFVFPGHGPPTGAAHEQVRAYITHRHMRERLVVEALQAAGGATDLDALVRQVYRDTPPTSWGFAAQSLLAHLELLERKGRARHDGTRWSLAS